MDRNDAWSLPFSYLIVKEEGYEGSESDAYADLGDCLEARKDIEGAIEALRRSVSLESGNSFAWYRLGNLLSNSRRYDEASDALRNAADLTPDHWVTLYKLGLALEGAMRHEEGIEAFSRASRLNPKASAPLMHRSGIHARLGNLDGAVGDLQTALQLEPGNKRVRALLEQYEAEQIKEHP